MDLVVLGLLLAQIVLGIVVSTQYPYGAAWAPATLMHYVWGLATLSPDGQIVADMPAAIRLHVVLAFITFALIPFSRLVHAFVVPVPYLFRLPQRVVWMTIRRADVLAQRPGGNPEEGRRAFVKGALGVAAAGVLLTAGVMDKLLHFLTGDTMDKNSRERHMSGKLAQLQQTAGQRQLELERMRSEYIVVAKLKDLQPKVGKYFIDYQMRPALAFCDIQGLPLLISAKCTHLGCTVGSTLDEQGRILCPCHISYFDLTSGRPNEGAPAKKPLPHIGWVLRAKDGTIVASKGAGAQVIGDLGKINVPSSLADLDVCIARKDEEA
jgi:Rieske Fe-S protein